MALVSAALLIATAARAQNTLINVVVDVTAEGRSAVQPTPAAPVYYFPVTVGYQEEGVWPSESLPPPMEVQRTVARALAAQGYLLLTKQSPASVLLSIRWGRIAPSVGDPDLQNPEKGMATLVGGVNMGSDVGDFNAHRDAFNQAASVPRYFITIEAYDFGSAIKKDKVPLWCARVSMQAAGKSLERAVPILAQAIAPLVGQDVRPKEIWVQ